eukprot:1119533-Amphidinium_carterae.1
MHPRGHQVELTLTLACMRVILCACTAMYEIYGAVRAGFDLEKKSTVFVRNIPFEATQEDLSEAGAALVAFLSMRSAFVSNVIMQRRCSDVLALSSLRPSMLLAW